MSTSGLTEEQRFDCKYEVTADGCWTWIAGLTRGGYAAFQIKRDGEWKSCLGHRLSYERHVGPIPEGLTLDHLCENIRCVNPEHLEPCTGGDNTVRSASNFAGANARKTRCPQGHPYAGDNLIIEGTARARRCRTCKNAKERRLYWRKQDSTGTGFAPDGLL